MKGRPVGHVLESLDAFTHQRTSKMHLDGEPGRSNRPPLTGMHVMMVCGIWMAG